MTKILQNSSRLNHATAFFCNNKDSFYSAQFPAEPKLTDLQICKDKSSKCFRIFWPCNNLENHMMALSPLFRQAF